MGVVFESLSFRVEVFFGFLTVLSCFFCFDFDIFCFDFFLLYFFFFHFFSNFLSRHWLNFFDLVGFTYFLCFSCNRILFLYSCRVFVRYFYFLRWIIYKWYLFGFNILILLIFIEFFWIGRFEK